MTFRHTPLRGENIDDPASEGVVSDNNAELLARALEQRSDYRVLRELDTGAGLNALPIPSPGEKIGIILDIETTGLDYAVDRPIEISIQRFLFDEIGRLTSVERPLSWLEDPGCALPSQVSKMTGIVDADVRGKSFDERAIVAALVGSDLIVAHNARFDRPFVDRRFAGLQNNKWACSLTQVDWSDLGFDGRSLGYLVMQAGWFYRGHRAQSDVVALAALLGTLVTGGRTIFSHLLERSSATTVRVDAVNAPFGVKDLLKGNGYRWDMMRRVWAKEINEEDVTAETLWLDFNVYQGRGAAAFHVVTAKDRFR